MYIYIYIYPGWEKPLRNMHWDSMLVASQWDEKMPMIVTHAQNTDPSLAFCSNLGGGTTLGASARVVVVVVVLVVGGFGAILGKDCRIFGCATAAAFPCSSGFGKLALGLCGLSVEATSAFVGAAFVAAASRFFAASCCSARLAS